MWQKYKKRRKIYTITRFIRKNGCVIMKNVIVCLVLLLSLALGVMPVTDQSLQRWDVTFKDCLSVIAGRGDNVAAAGGNDRGAVAVGEREDSSVVNRKSVTVARRAAR